MPILIAVVDLKVTTAILKFGQIPSTGKYNYFCRQNTWRNDFLNIVFVSPCHPGLHHTVALTSLRICMGYPSIYVL